MSSGFVKAISDARSEALLRWGKDEAAQKAGGESASIPVTPITFAWDLFRWFSPAAIRSMLIATEALVDAQNQGALRPKIRAALVDAKTSSSSDTIDNDGLIAYLVLAGQVNRIKVDSTQQQVIRVTHGAIVKLASVFGDVGKSSRTLDEMRVLEPLGTVVFWDSLERWAFSLDSAQFFDADIHDVLGWSDISNRAGAAWDAVGSFSDGAADKVGETAAKVVKKAAKLAGGTIRAFSDELGLTGLAVAALGVYALVNMPGAAASVSSPAVTNAAAATAAAG